MAYLRERLASWRPLQGAVISINGLAQTLDVSHTPVREALAMLAGEGLIVRTPAGYAGATFLPVTLAAHYDMAELLLCRVISRIPPDAWPGTAVAASPESMFEVLVEHQGDAVLNEAYQRVAAQLAPFRSAAAEVLRDGERTIERLSAARDSGDRRGLLGAARAYHGRRRRAAGSILVTAIGVGAQS